MAVLGRLGRSWSGLGVVLAALRKQGFGAFSDPTSSEQVTWFLR